MKDMCYKYADYLITLYIADKNENKILMTNRRLQQLLFYASVEYAKKNNGKPLFSDDFYAYPTGPVIPDVYNKYSIFQTNYIFPLNIDKPIIDYDKKEILEKVYKDTKKISTHELMIRTQLFDSQLNFNAKIEKARKSGLIYPKIENKDIFNFYKNDKNYKLLYQGV